tara:strand:- start:1143 stop:1721 length:579 start_codon:yes stop_codon:yes gene_type:complete
MIYHLLALDPGFANLGYAVRKVGGRKTLNSVVELGTFRTKPSVKKRRIRSVDDNERRIGELWDGIHGLVESYSPAVIAVEAFSPPRSSSTAAKIAMVYGMLLAISREEGTPFLSITPQEAKEAVCGKRNASKDEIEDRLLSHYGPCDSAWDAGIQRTGGFPDGACVHAWDALAIAHATLDDPLIRAICKRIG